MAETNLEKDGGLDHQPQMPEGFESETFAPVSEWRERLEASKQEHGIEEKRARVRELGLPDVIHAHPDAFGTAIETEGETVDDVDKKVA